MGVYLRTGTIIFTFLSFVIAVHASRGPHRWNGPYVLERENGGLGLCSKEVTVNITIIEGAERRRRRATLRLNRGRTVCTARLYRVRRGNNSTKFLHERGGRRGHTMCGGVNLTVKFPRPDFNATEDEEPRVMKIRTETAFCVYRKKIAPAPRELKKGLPEWVCYLSFAIAAVSLALMVVFCVRDRCRSRRPRPPPPSAVMNNVDTDIESDGGNEQEKEHGCCCGISHEWWRTLVLATFAIVPAAIGALIERGAI